MESPGNLIRSFTAFFVISLLFVALVVLDFFLIKTRVVHYAMAHTIGASSTRVSIASPNKSPFVEQKIAATVQSPESKGTVSVSHDAPAPARAVTLGPHEVPATGPRLFDTLFTSVLVAVSSYLSLFLVKQRPSSGRR